jgi:hypothetical protein
MWDVKLQGEAIKQHSEKMGEEQERRDESVGRDNETENERTRFYADVMNGCWDEVIEDATAV